MFARVREVLPVTRRPVLLVLVVAVLAGVVTFGVQSARDGVYVSQTLLAVDAPSAMTAGGGRPDNVVFVARSYATRADITPVIDDAIERAGVDMSRLAARQATAARVSSQDGTVTIEARATDPDHAEALATALAEALQEYVRDEQLADRDERMAPLENRIAEVESEFVATPADSPRRAALEREYQALVSERAAAQVEPLDRLVLLSPAEVPTTPVSPRPARDAVIAAVLGGALAAEAIIGARMFRDGRRSDV